MLRHSRLAAMAHPHMPLALNFTGKVHIAGLAVHDRDGISLIGRSWV
jgi:hypothetical protein